MNLQLRTFVDEWFGRRHGNLVRIDVHGNRYRYFHSVLNLVHTFGSWQVFFGRVFYIYLNTDIYFIYIKNTPLLLAGDDIPSTPLLKFPMGT